MRAADADVDDIGNRITRESAPALRAHIVNQTAHPRERVSDLRSNRLTVDTRRGAWTGAQCRVQHGAPLRRVDRGTVEHRFDRRRQIGGGRKIDKPCQRFVIQ